MQLTKFTDYSLRVLLYLAYRENQMVTISELADFYQISRNHLVKVVHKLGIQGYVHSTRGKNGGLRLARPANEIRIGDVVRKMEVDFNFLECFSEATDHCVITKLCALKSVLISTRDEFLNTLDQYTVADAIHKSSKKTSNFKSIPVVQG